MTDGGPVDIDAAEAASGESEVLAAARAYEDALAAGDTEAASAWFATDPRTSRFGPDGSQLDLDAVRALRASAAPTPPATWVHESARTLAPGVVLHLAILERGGTTVQRTQLWTRTEEGWRIAHAHVSNPRSP